eukprot:13283641-Ditylum_brightwellii.AAC.1
MKSSPQDEWKFYTNMEVNAHRSDVVNASFGLDIVQHHKAFKAFFSLQDPVKAVPSQKKGPNWKIKALL